MCPDFENDYGVTSYISFLDSLIDEAKDVIDLRKEGILRNLLGSDEEVALVFNEIGTDLVPNPEIYRDVRSKIQKYHEKKRMTYINEVIHKHFSSPWTVVAFTAALFALILSIAQTVKNFKIKRDLVAFVKQDLLLLENPLPYQLLEDLMKNSRQEQKLRNSIRSFIYMESMIKIEMTENQPIHLLDLLQSRLIGCTPPSHDDNQIGKKDWNSFCDGQGLKAVKNFKIKRDLVAFVKQDLLLLENPLPYQLLEDLMKNSRQEQKLRNSIRSFIYMESMTKIEMTENQPIHLLDLLQSRLIGCTPPSHDDNQIGKKDWNSFCDGQGLKAVQLLRDHKHFEKYCEPREVSIGHIHHGKPKYRLAEEYKLTLAENFIEESGKTDKELYMVIKSNIEQLRNYEGEKLRESVQRFINMQSMIGKTQEEPPNKEPVHLLDLLRNRLLGCTSVSPENNSDQEDWHLFRNVQELKAVGIHLKSSNDGCLRNITFTQKYWKFYGGTLSLPPIIVDDSTRPKFLNLIAYDMLTQRTI
ncbi:upf0481 protein [Quercus suber]|uniref:Upf0481 protein n=1 Tax=Quercus suber TaxID=58331 RepID=A0AAW0IY28_QUESU